MMEQSALSRRSLLTMGLALIAAPAIVRASSLMPIKSFPVFPKGGISVSVAPGLSVIYTKSGDIWMYHADSETLRMMGNVPAGISGIDTGPPPSYVISATLTP